MSNIFNRSCDDHRPENMITCIAKDELRLYERAVNIYSELTERDLFYINENAYDYDGSKLNGYFGLYMKEGTEGCEVTCFFIILESVMNSNWRRLIAALEDEV